MGEYVAARAPTYKPEDVQKALRALLAFGGSAGAASTALQVEYGLTVPPETLVQWRDIEHAEEYAGLQQEHGQDLEDAMVREIRDVTRQAMAVERLAIEKAASTLALARPAEAAQIALNMSKIKAGNIDKLLALTGRPQQITEHRSATELLRALQSKGVLALEES